MTLHYAEDERRPLAPMLTAPGALAAAYAPRVADRLLGLHPLVWISSALLAAICLAAEAMQGNFLA